MKKHFKMYKAGKLWCCAAITVLTAIALGSTAASADTTATAAATTEPQSSVVAAQTNTAAAPKTAASDNTASIEKQNDDNTSQNDTTAAQTGTTAASQKTASDSTNQNTNNTTTSNDSANQASTTVKVADQNNSATAVSATGEKNTFVTINGNVYYYDNNSNLYKGWYENWGNKYYFKSDGARATSEKVDLGNNATYYFDNQGIMYHNQFLTQNGKVYYFGNDGKEYKDQFYSNWGNLYYFGKDGARYTNQWYTNWGHKYYFGADGARYTHQFLNQNGKMYYFDNQGVMYQNQFYKNWGNTYYFGSDGSRWDNSFMVRWGHVYYFGNDGALLTNQSRKINGTTYNFDKDGVIAGVKSAFFTDHDGKVYYFDQNGKEYQDQFYSNWGNLYYFGKDGARYTNQFYKNWGNTYYFGKDGVRYTSQFLTKDGKTYYFDGQGVMLTSQVKKLNGQLYGFDQNGYATKLNSIDNTRDAFAEGIGTALTAQGVKGLEYDWQNESHHYNELALHDIAQEVAQGDTKADKAVIAKKLAADDVLKGDVLTVETIKLSGVADSDSLAKQLLSTAKANDNAVLGVGANLKDDKLVLILFKPNTATEVDTASTIAASVNNVYKNPGVTANVKDGLTKGAQLGTADLGSALSKVSSYLLTGEKGTAISQDTLKAIFNSLAGNSSALEGTKNYSDGTDTYHYEFWLNGQSSTDKLNNFLNANKGVKYGDQLKVDYNATLVYGKETGTDKPAVDKTPAAKKTASQLDLAYKTGSDTGLIYDSVKVDPIPGMSEDTVRGVDVSSYQSLINAGVQFYDFNGQPASLFKVLSDAGVNYVRLRLWNDPYNADGMGYAGGNNDEANLIKMAKEASKYGMKVLLDFHYSDFWADPAKQPLPKAWKNLSSDALKKEVYLYTAKVVNDLKANNVNVGMIQIGNEITNGVFGIYSNRDAGESWSNIWGNKSKASQICTYLEAASQAIRKYNPLARIVIQLETPNISKYRTILTAIKNGNVDYDYLGTSYYPFWSTDNDNGSYEGKSLGKGANTPNNLLAVEKMVQKEFGKKTVVLETGWINNERDADGTGNSVSNVVNTYSHDPQGQVDEMAAMYKAIIAGQGVGSFYWEPAWIPVKAGWDNWSYNNEMSNEYGTGWASKYAVGYAPNSVMFYNGKPTWGGTTWDNVSLFDDHGYPLQSLMMYKGFLTGYKSPSSLTQG